MNTLRCFLLLVGLTWSPLMPAQVLPAYQWFEGPSSKSCNFRQVLKACKNADVVFFGEIHNDPLAHWMELELLKGLQQVREGELIVGMEMLETDQNIVVGEYSQKLIRYQDFENALDLWSNFETDYRPLVEWAIQHQTPVLGTNIPRRYANLIYRGGISALMAISPRAQELFLPPLPWPIDLNFRAYQEMDRLFGESSEHGGSGMKEAQAAKDYVMAWNIAQQWSNGQLVYHINGSFHSDYYSGIVDYLKQINPALKIVTISTVRQKKLDKLQTEQSQKADFILVTPEEFPRTY
ncbi:MAG: ChaN family lipoprotein [Bacteroidota bacterium]